MIFIHTLLLGNAAAGGVVAAAVSSSIDSTAVIEL